jgi:hypothetical protein
MIPEKFRIGVTRWLDKYQQDLIDDPANADIIEELQQEYAKDKESLIIKSWNEFKKRAV